MQAHFYSSLELIRPYVPGMCEREIRANRQPSVSFIKFRRSVSPIRCCQGGAVSAIAAIVREVIPNMPSARSAPAPYRHRRCKPISTVTQSVASTTYEAIVGPAQRMSGASPSPIRRKWAI